MMIDLTADARTTLDAYIERMRSALRGSRAVEATEVEQNVLDHVEIALAGIPAPVGVQHLGPVLAQLGPPDRWLPEDERPAWRRILGHITTGPEDWRLAYLSFAATCLMILTFPIGGIVLLIPAFLLSRAHISLSEERGESLGARRWLVLPPIVIVALALMIVVLFGPIVGAAAWGIDEGGFDHLLNRHVADPPPLEHARIVAGFVSSAAGVWWLILSGLVALSMTPLRAILKPFGSRWKRKHALMLTAAGAVFAGIGATLLFAM